jgi:hypothetical protein
MPSGESGRTALFSSSTPGAFHIRRLFSMTSPPAPANKWLCSGPFKLRRATEIQDTSCLRRLKEDAMKTRHFTYRVPRCTEKAIRLPLPAIDVRERSPVEKYRRNIVKFETTPDERRILMPRVWPRSP